MSMLDSLRSKLGIDPEADSYVDDTEENVFPGGQGAAAAQEYTQQQEIKQHSNKVVNTRRPSCRLFWSNRNALTMRPALRTSSTPSILWC